jgi:predicted DCC family thiol-disulfide oxidoreductase YuxK
MDQRPALLQDVAIVYDGDCGICAASAAFARDCTTQHGITFVASQALDIDARAAIEAQTGAGIFDRSVVLVRDGRTLIGARAINAAIAALFPRSAPLLAIVDRVPPLVALEDAAYRFFARHRRTLLIAVRLIPNLRDGR